MSEKWDRIRKQAGSLFVAFFLLLLLDFAAFAVIDFLIGGSFLYGEVVDDEYFIGQGHGQAPIQVSKATYYYSVYHYWTLIPLAAAAALSAFTCLIAWSVSPGRRRLELRVTSDGIALNGKPVSIAVAVDAARESQAMGGPGICVVNDYEACDAPQHAVAFQLELIRHKIRLAQESPRKRDRT